nr:MAG TPA: hypothetical protein [Caudoviricetes sp.]
MCHSKRKGTNPRGKPWGLPDPNTKIATRPWAG